MQLCNKCACTRHCLISTNLTWEKFPYLWCVFNPLLWQRWAFRPNIYINGTLTICDSQRIWAYSQVIHWVPLSFSCNGMVPWPDVIMTSARRGSYKRVTEPIQTTKIWQLFETQFSVVWLNNASIHDEICVRFGCLGDDGGSGMLSDTSTRWLLRISIEFPWLLPRYVNFFMFGCVFTWQRLNLLTKQRPIDYHCPFIGLHKRLLALP